MNLVYKANLAKAPHLAAGLVVSVLEEDNTECHAPSVQWMKSSREDQVDEHKMHSPRMEGDLLVERTPKPAHQSYRTTFLLDFRKATKTPHHSTARGRHTSYYHGVILVP